MRPPGLRGLGGPQAWLWRARGFLPADLENRARGLGEGGAPGRGAAEVVGGMSGIRRVARYADSSAILLAKAGEVPLPPPPEAPGAWV
jgi:hypothetical protein